MTTPKRPGEEFRDDEVQPPNPGKPGTNPIDHGRPGERFRDDEVQPPNPGAPGQNPKPKPGSRPGEEFRED